MAPGRDEIRRHLTELAARWGGYQGSERAEAQTFLNELLACYGVDRHGGGIEFEPTTRGGFVDMLWPGVCLVEMKRPSEAARLEAHRDQAFDYWKTVGRPGMAAPPFVVLCAFHRFLVYKPDEGWDEPRADFELTELTEHADALGFLAGRSPSFESQAVLTRDAVALVADLHGRIERRHPERREVARDFTLQCVWTMFAEKLGMLGSNAFTAVLDELIASPRRSSADDLHGLFQALATPGERPEHGLYAGVPYVDGGLFEEPARVHLDPEELTLLRKAASFDWRRVEPAIFGSLLEGALGSERQWALGAHYTHEADILKVVLPTVVEPWRERIAACGTAADCEAAERDLMRYVVLDPACGSGNFLYVAYRHLRRIEAELYAREDALRREAGLGPRTEERGYFPLANMRGIEIEQFAVALARVTLWMGHKLAVDELGLDEAVLPLVDLSGIQLADALQVKWPRADAIIGNPPYHGDRNLRSELGDDYVEWLKDAYGIGVKDYCVYWFRKAHDNLPDEGRAGLVGTNSISQNRGRGASLDYIVAEAGVITNAVSTQDWSGEAAVDVSIVNWLKKPRTRPAEFLLDGVMVDGITASLRSAAAGLETARSLRSPRRAFQGPIPGANYLIPSDIAERLIVTDKPRYRDVVRPYLVGEDIASHPQQQARRWIIDFGLRTLEQAQVYPEALGIVRRQAKAAREESTSFGRNQNWWQFLWPRPLMRKAFVGLNRYIGGTATGKRLLFVWCDLVVCPSNAMNVFAFDDDYPMGILASRIHEGWARAQSSTLEDRLRYTPTSAFKTFPWPQPTPEQREAIADLSRRLIARRSEICVERQIGLTRLYNEVDDGAYRDLRQLHRELDEAVATAYGWPASVAHGPAESNRRLLELNRAIAAGEIAYAPFG